MGTVGENFLQEEKEKEEGEEEEEEEEEGEEDNGWVTPTTQVGEEAPDG